MENLDKKKVHIKWGYELQSPEGIWVNSYSPEIRISIDQFEAADYLILYESKSIVPHLYSRVNSLKGNYKKVFTHDLSICDGSNIVYMPPFIPPWVDKNSEAKIYDKTELVSMIASVKNMCEGHQYRQKIANAFPYKDHLYGFGRIEIPRKVDGLKKYMFSVCMENSVYDTYYTEKLLDCFLTGTIPVYWGSKKIGDIFNSKGVLWVDEINIKDLNEELYYSMLPYVKENFEIAMNLKSSSGDMIDYIVKNYGI
jgi:hypothetical protein